MAYMSCYIFFIYIKTDFNLIKAKSVVLSEFAIFSHIHKDWRNILAFFFIYSRTTIFSCSLNIMQGRFNNNFFLLSYFFYVTENRVRYFNSCLHAFISILFL